MANVINATSTGNGGLVSTGDDSGILNIQTNETTAITVDASQNVGIGNTSPSFPLDIVKSANGNAHAKITNSNGGGSAASAWTASNGTLTSQFGITGASYTSYGILTANSAYIYNTNDISLGADNASGVIKFGTGSGINERMRIGSNGQIYMATTSAVAPGGPSGQVNILNPNDDGNWALALQNNGTTAGRGRGIGIKNNVDFNTNSSEFIYCTGAGNGRFYVTSNGGIYNYSANNVNLSDQREKKDIALASNYLDKICQIPVKTFLFNDQTDADLNLGAIAQDVQAVCPELVTESNWGTEEQPKIRLSIYQTDLQYALMKSIQELKAINDTQAETINALTARIVALEGQ